jgi:putative addiction module killer protein
MDVIPQRVMMLVLEDGSCPLADWLLSMNDITTRARITRQIDKLQRGNFGVRRGVGEAIAELKLDFGPGYRVYYVRMTNVIVVLLGGSDKSGQPRGITRARSLWKEFKLKGLPDARLAQWENSQPNQADQEDLGS